MIYLGDFPADQAINFMWNTNGADGASITRATDGVISVYKDNSDGSSYDQTQVTTGITNDEDVDGLTGVHSCCITTTNAWYETGHDYSVVLSASTIDGRVVNVVIAQFSIENRFLSSVKTDLQNLLEADTKIITTDSEQWKLVYYIKDTEDILLTKDLKDVTGDPIISTSLPVGQHIDA